MQITDGLNRRIRLEAPPKRIISLVPSLTELLFDLGLEEQIVGVTKFCVHPERARKQIQRVGGTKKFNFEQIDLLNPDLIVANKEENYKEGIEQLIESYPVYVSDIFNLEDATRTIRDLGTLCEQSMASEKMIKEIHSGFKAVKNILNGNVLYFIWQSPDMVVGSDNFIDSIFSWLGLSNVAGHIPRYPEIPKSELAKLSPDYVFLSSEPYPFKEKHLRSYKELFPRAKVLLVDGEMFSWYGSRLRYAPEYFDQLSELLN